MIIRFDKIYLQLVGDKAISLEKKDIDKILHLYISELFLDFDLPDDKRVISMIDTIDYNEVVYNIRLDFNMNTKEEDTWRRYFWDCNKKQERNDVIFVYPDEFENNPESTALAAF